MTKATWYFDFISPYSYLQLLRFNELPGDLEITIKPIVLSGLLEHWGHKGPAEIPSKRRFVYRFFKWLAARRGIEFTMPPVHPFNPLPPLRLALLARADREAILKIFQFLYREGRNLDDDEAITGLAESLGIPDACRRISEPRFKEELKANTDAAIADGVFGVPTFIVEGELFWGDDATEMLLNFLNDRSLFDETDMRRISNMPMGLRRSGL